MIPLRGKNPLIKQDSGTFRMFFENFWQAPPLFFYMGVPGVKNESRKTVKIFWVKGLKFYFVEQII